MVVEGVVVTHNFASIKLGSNAEYVQLGLRITLFCVHFLHISDVCWNMCKAQLCFSPCMDLRSQFFSHSSSQYDLS